MKSRTIFWPINLPKRLINEEKEIREEFKNHPVVILTEKVIDLIRFILK